MISTGRSIRRIELGLGLWLGFWVVLFFSIGAEGKCSSGCDLALASYYLWTGSYVTFISQVFNAEVDSIHSFNPEVPTNGRSTPGTRLNVPFTCDCIDGEFLGHVFDYSFRSSDTYDKVAQIYYSNLTTVQLLQRFNRCDPNNIPDFNARLNVTVNCYCGDTSVSMDYGLFVTYPLRPGESLESVASEFNLSSDLLQLYNPNSNFSRGNGLVYIPGKAGLSVGTIAGICIAAVVAAALFLVVCIYIGLSRRKRTKKALLLSAASEGIPVQHGCGDPSPLATSNKTTKMASPTSLASLKITCITMDKSVEFPYEELAKATDDFSLANKIGQGGFAAVYYAELRGKKAAIKKMDMQASKEFLAEMKVLTHVHHLNLVCLIGHCVEGSLFLVYEFIDNGNLSEHLCGSGKESLSWSTRMHIALDSARGLQYINEQTVPAYIHRDIKSANILIDKNFRGKVIADFGLTKLAEVRRGSFQARYVGTFGYMPPEYAKCGNITPKVDVYAFGVVLYELISAKEAVVKTNESNLESRGLTALFEDVLNQPDPREELCKLVDPRLGDNYPLDSVFKMAQLAKACTQENPQLRPSMRSIVVALMTFSSSTEDWDVASLYENHGLVKLMSGR
ncbi:Protein kinase domain [Macleaya cordata]|uniref:non-specific serine/threonine protein kinase n=1 Tax=Macleaya cordata TaxID=56857 RepID=A0A200PZ46_MACCD|nr:Protein kinase domain [Macleaya cordata]